MAASSVPHLAPSKTSAPAENAKRNVTPATSKKLKGKEKETVENAISKPGKSRGSRKGAATARKQWDGQSHSWAWRTLAESSVSNRPAVFTSDGNYFFSAVGTAVRIYSASSGKIVSTLSSSSSGSSGSRQKVHGSHTDRVTSIILNPANQYQVITASLDGSIKIWDFLEAVLLRTIDVGSPITHMCAHGEIDGQVFVATRVGKNAELGAGESKENTLVYRVSLTPSSDSAESGSHKPAEMLCIGKTRPAMSMALSHNGSFLIVIGGYKSYVAMSSHLEKGFTKFVSPERLKCLACHPSDDYFATGDEKGQIRLWYCLDNQIANMASGVEKRAQTTTLHWHAHSISTIAFTPNGAYLLSGGEESVLVIWQLQNGRKEFVPRMGSPILNVAIRRGREEEYLLGLSDGSYVFVGASTLSISRTISRVKLGPSKSLAHKAAPTPFAFHPQSSTIIIPSSHPSSLQIYSPKSLDAVGELEVAPSNRVSKRDEKPIEPFVVEKVVIDNDGNWMASVDRRENEDDLSSEIYLKIWRWESNSWVLNTRVDRPHGTEPISALSFCPRSESEPLLMTAGADGCVKMWRLRMIETKTGERECFWVNRSRFQFRSEKPSDVCWSHDGSLLAICFKPHVVLIDPFSNTILETLDAPEVKEPSRVRFVGASGRYLMAFNNRDIVMWDLISRSVLWATQTSSYIIHALPHPKRDLIALILQPYVEGTEQRTSKVLLFGCASGKPTSTNSVPFRLRACSWYPDGHDMTLVGVTDAWNVVLFGDKLASRGDPEIGPRRIDQSALPGSQRTLFEDVFGASALAAGTSRDHSSVEISSETHNAQHALSTFSAPAYLAPPIDSLYSSLMDHFVSKMPENGHSAEDVQTHQNDEMAVDEDLPVANAPFAGRTVEEDEFNSLVALFRAQSLSRPVPKKTMGTPNGRHKVHQKNGLVSKTSSPLVLVAPNGSASATPPPVTKSHPNGQPSPEHDSGSPVIVGKKRKTGQIS